MKKRTLIIASICFGSLLTGAILQFRILPTEVWESGRFETSGLSTDRTTRFSYLVQQGHLVEGQAAQLSVTFAAAGSDSVELFPEVPTGGRISHTKDGGLEVTLPVHPTHAGEDSLELPLGITQVGNPNVPGHIPIAVTVRFDVSPSLFHRVWLTVLLSLPFSVLGIAAYGWIVARRRAMRGLEARVEKAEIKVEREPSRARFAWELASVKLEAYFDRNLAQVNQVFAFAVVVMAVGFCFVLLGVVLSFGEKQLTPIEVVAGGAGVITEFIGATFMALYRSTMAQANEFMSILERINTVGMAVQVLDSIPDANVDLKNATRAHIVELLLSSNTHSKPSPQEAKSKIPV